MSNSRFSVTAPMRAAVALLVIMATGRVSASSSPDPFTFEVPSGRTLAEVRESVKLGIKGRLWKIESEEPGVVIGRLESGANSARVRVEYGESKVSVHYVDSKLDADDPVLTAVPGLIRAYLRSPSLDVYTRFSAPLGPGIALLTPVPWFNKYGGDAAVQMRCSWNSRLTGQIIDLAHGRVEPVAQIAGNGATLKIVIDSVGSIRNATDGESRIVRLSGELRQNGTLIGSFKAAESIDSAKDELCESLEALADALAIDIVIWLRQPSLYARLGSVD